MLCVEVSPTSQYFLTSCTCSGSFLTRGHIPVPKTFGKTLATMASCTKLIRTLPLTFCCFRFFFCVPSCHRSQLFGLPLSQSAVLLSVPITASLSGPLCLLCKYFCCHGSFLASINQFYTSSLLSFGGNDFLTVNYQNVHLVQDITVLTFCFCSV